MIEIIMNSKLVLLNLIENQSHISVTIIIHFPNVNFSKEITQIGPLFLVYFFFSLTIFLIMLIIVGTLKLENKWAIKRNKPNI